MSERHLMCERWPNDAHSLCRTYGDAALEFQRTVSELCVRIDQARVQMRDDGADEGMDAIARANAARAAECALRNLYRHRADGEADS